MTLNWILSSFLSSIILVIIILFKSEIRRVLAQVGRSPFVKTTAETLQTIEEVIRAAVYLSSHSTGALIVLERQTGLGEIVQTGTALEARVGWELMVSIFHSQSPLHDGAMIIRNNQIAAVACYLPLTRSTKVSRSYGTRHRAALGLTEKTDAAVIVVSEETGRISVAIKGRFTRGLDSTTLKRVLQTLFTQEKAHRTYWLFGPRKTGRRPGRLRNIFFKILALVLAVILWFLVVGEERAEVGLTIPLELVNMPRDLIVVNNLTQGIDIRVNGPRSLIRSLTTRNLSKSLDLSNSKAGTVTFPISSEGIRLPRGVAITRIHPTQVVVVLQKQVKKTIPVKARVIGRPANGYEVDSVKIRPEEVEVAGPEEVIKELENLFTKPVDISGRRDPLVQEVPLDFRFHADQFGSKPHPGGGSQDQKNRWPIRRSDAKTLWNRRDSRGGQCPSHDHGSGPAIRQGLRLYIQG